VVALYLRSNVSEGLGVIPSTSAAMKDKKDNTELQYASIINRVLPDDIRVLAWAPVPLDFSARFSCLYRTYKYFFTAGDMDIPVSEFEENGVLNSFYYS
jgi:tRNA pseudouridine38/39 synthase